MNLFPLGTINNIFFPYQVIAAAQAGKHNENRESYGDTLIIDPWGTVVGRLPGENYCLSICCFFLSLSEESRYCKCISICITCYLFSFNRLIDNFLYSFLLLPCLVVPLLSVPCTLVIDH